MMKNRQLHTIILPLCTLLLFSCTQDTISPASDSENEIRFQTGTPTRGLIDNLAVGSEICLYGYHGGIPLADGTSKALEGKTLAYRNFNGSNRWSVVNGDNPITYFWEGTGTYRFFGWLQKDANGLTAAGLTTNYAKNKLTVSGTLNYQYNQFDFMYSDVDQRTLTDENMANEKGRPVAMNMNHLFSAFSIGISNTSQDDITVKSIKLQRLHTTGSATIDFSGDNTAVTYTNYPTASAYSTEVLASYASETGYTLAAGGSSQKDIFNPSATVEANVQKYYMVWPQAQSVIFDANLEGKTPEEEAKLGDECDIYYPLIMEYSIGNESTIRKKRMKFPNMAWLPGMKYSFNVKFADKEISLVLQVEPWTYSSSAVDFSDGTIEVNGNNSLTWDKTKGVVDDTEATVTVKGAQPVEATFALSAPVGGKWMVSFKDGDVTSFKIEDDAEDANDGIGPIDGAIHRIKVTPLVKNPTRDYQVRLKFSVQTADGKTIPIDDIIQVEKNANGEIVYENGKPKQKIYTIVLKNAN